MKWIVIGHRGVGKSQFLLRLKTYLQSSSTAFLDLDQEIEKRLQTPIIKLFPEIGETRFREIEQQVFREIEATYPSYVLSVGGGFQLAQSRAQSKDLKVIWLRRKSDEHGRIFLDRPRLNAGVSPLQEFKERFELRQKIYSALADEAYWLPEGLDQPHPIEEKLWSASPIELAAQGILTLQEWQLRKFETCAQRFGCALYEIRDDLLDLDATLWRKVPHEKRLLSFRLPKKSVDHLRYLSQTQESDWALELGPCPTNEISVLSCHERLSGENLTAFLLRLEKAGSTGQHLKAAPVIESLAEAQEILRWQSENPSQRSVLPRSPAGVAGRWMWLRLYLKGRQKINFWRESDGSAADQPTLFEWLSTQEKTQAFAALIGNPVHHSRTMIEQSEFFAAKNQPVWPILLEETEFKEALPFLISLGLTAAAVTSPFKGDAFQACDQLSAEAQRLQAVNTLSIASKTVSGHNTDLKGLRAQIEKACRLIQVPVVGATALIWGGGGTLGAIQEILPQAISVSVRTRRPRSADQSLPASVQVLVWAAGPEDDFPPEVNFEILVDLNYREDSRAREWALRHGRPYVSGLDLFKAQAAGQREYWTRLEKK